MQRDHCTPSRGGIEINSAAEIFDPGNNVFQADTFKFFLVAIVKLAELFFIITNPIRRSLVPLYFYLSCNSYDLI